MGIEWIACWRSHYHGKSHNSGTPQALEQTKALTFAGRISYTLSKPSVSSPMVGGCITSIAGLSAIPPVKSRDSSLFFNSQPPLFIQMLYNYVQNTNDTSFLRRAVELSDREMMWWDRNNSINVTSPSGQTYFMHHYDVLNSAPRPESYLEDWETVNGPLGGPYLNLSTDLYAETASGAESGIDYSLARWGTDPLAYPSDTTAGLRNLNVTGQIPVDLNAILYRNYVILAEYHEKLGNSSRSQYWDDRARKLKSAILDLHWDSQALIFRDFNMTANAKADKWFLASYWPYFSGIIPNEVLTDQSAAQKAFSGLGYLTAK